MTTLVDVARSVARRRPVRFLLCLLFLPLAMIVTAPGVANAGSSEVQTFQIDEPWSGDITCQIGLVIVTATGGSQMSVSSGGWCQGNVIPTPLCDGLEVECTSVFLSVRNGLGDECASQQLDEVSDSGHYNKTLNLGASVIPLETTCDPAQICLQVVYSGSADNEAKSPTCRDSALDLPSKPQLSGCGVGGFVTEPSTTGSRANLEAANGTYGGTQYGRGRIGYSGKVTKGTGAPSTYSHAYFYVLIAGMAGQNPYWKHISAGVPAGTGVQTKIDGDSRMPDPGFDRIGAVAQAVKYHTVVGYGIILAPSSISSAAQIRTPADPTGKVGMTNPADCHWYWGTKVADDPTSTNDEPMGPVNLEEPLPDPVPPVVDPPEDEDVEDEPSFWSAILSVLKSIWNAIKALGSAIAGIAGAIIKGIKDLFIPRDGFFEDKIDGLEDAADGTKIGNMLEAFTDLQPTSATGCEGPEFSIPVFGSGGAPSHPMSACGGAMATLAGTSRLILTISISVGAALACIRVLGRGFGWDPGIGGGGSS